MEKTKSEVMDVCVVNEEAILPTAVEKLFQLIAEYHGLNSKIKGKVCCIVGELEANKGNETPSPEPVYCNTIQYKLSEIINSLAINNDILNETYNQLNRVV